MDEKSLKEAVAARIRSLAGRVPTKQYQTWGVLRVRSFKLACVEARKLADRPNVSLSQLNAMESQLLAYWQ